MNKYRLQVVDLKHLNEVETLNFKTFNNITKEMIKRDNCVLRNISFNYSDQQVYSEIIGLLYLNFNVDDFKDKDYSINIRLYRYFSKSSFLSFISRTFFSENLDLPLEIANVFIKRIEEELLENHTLIKNHSN